MLPVLDREELNAIIDTVYLYLRGMHESDLDALRRAFHPNLQSYGYRESKLSISTGQNFIDLVDSLDTPADIGERFDMGIEQIDVTGSVAHVRVRDLHLGMVYTDYLALVKIEGRWLIVNKMYHKHQDSKAIK